MQRIFVSFRVHRYGLNAELMASTNDSKGDLTAIRDEDFFER
jgi:hypothetical protein